MIVISLTRVKRGLGLFARVFALLFLAGVAIPKAVDALATLIAPAGSRAVGTLGSVVQTVLRIIGVGR